MGAQNLIGPQGRLFVDPQPGGDAASFRIDSTRAKAGGSGSSKRGNPHRRAR